MSQQRLDGKQVSAVLIQMDAEGMTEGVAGKPALPSGPVLMGMDVAGKEKGVDGSVLPVLLREEISPGSSICKPVFSKQVKCRLGDVIGCSAIPQMELMPV